MTRRNLEHRVDNLEEQLAEVDAEREDDPTDLWRAFNGGGLTLEEWKRSAKQ